MKHKNIVTTVLVCTFIIGMSLWCVLGKKADYSDSERRVLASFPEMTKESILSGEFAKDFEEYVTDTFPIRDAWRSIKAYAQTNVFMKKDNNDIFKADGHISKLEYPMNKQMADYAIQLFSKINEKYLGDNKAYMVIIPDKNRFIADKNGYLSLDYEFFSEYMAQGVDFAQYIEISDLLEADDYYYTDTHWRQDKIMDVAEHIAGVMGADVSDTYRENKLDTPFNGVYVGQSALNCKPDEIIYLTNDTINGAITEGAKAVYDMNKAAGKDPYEMYLSGNQPIVTIKNPTNEGGKKLIMFRDSYGSSIAPLFIKGYSEIVMIDLRYISSDFLGQFVDFENADVLFMYSTLLLNNSLSMR